MVSESLRPPNGHIDVRMIQLDRETRPAGHFSGNNCCPRPTERLINGLARRRVVRDRPAQEANCACAKLPAGSSPRFSVGSVPKAGLCAARKFGITLANDPFSRPSFGDADPKSVIVKGGVSAARQEALPACCAVWCPSRGVCLPCPPPFPRVQRALPGGLSWV